MRDIRASVEVRALIGAEKLRELHGDAFAQYECCHCGSSGRTTEPTSIVVLGYRVFRVAKLAHAAISRLANHLPDLGVQQCTSHLTDLPPGRRLRISRFRAQAQVAAMPEDSYPVRWVGQQAVVTLPDHLDVSNAGQIEQELLWVISRGATALIVDMTATVSCDHAGADVVVPLTSMPSSPAHNCSWWSPPRPSSGCWPSTASIA
jgi:hypothetical protein